MVQLVIVNVTVVDSIFTGENNLFYYFSVKRQSAALSSFTQHAMPEEFGGKWGTECLNIRFTRSLCLPCYVGDIT